MAVRTAKPIQSRKRILDAATRLMAENGYAGTSISKIVRLSGLPASSTYWHFGNKEKLLAAVIDQAGKEFFRTAPKLDGFEGMPRERFRARLQPRTRRTVDFLRLLFLIALERGDAKGETMATIRRVREAVKDEYRQDFRAIYGDDGSPESRRFIEDLATFSLATLDGLFLAREIDPGRIESSRILSMLADAFLGLGDDFHASRRNGQKARPIPRKATAKTGKRSAS